MTLPLAARAMSSVSIALFVYLRSLGGCMQYA